MSIANAFSGGIFLAIALLHIIPESHTHYLVYLHNAAIVSGNDIHKQPITLPPDMANSTDYSPSNLFELGGIHRFLHGTDNVHEFLELKFPFPYFMVFVGYTFILLIDKVLFDTHSLHHKNENLRDSIMRVNHKRQRSNSQSNDIDGINFYNQKYNEFKDEDEVESQNDDIDISEGIRQYLSKADRFSARMSEALSKKHKNRKRNSRDANFNGSRIRSNTGDPTNSNRLHSDQKLFTSAVSTGSDTTPNDFFNVTILMIALSTHSVFEGIAVGLQKDIADVWNFFVAIGLHKWAAAMSLGISMSYNLENKRTFVTMLLIIFASATPIGLIIGMLIMESPPLINIIFSSLAGGTFLYISASEVVVEEFSIPHNKWVKLAGFILGALIIAFVTSIEE